MKSDYGKKAQTGSTQQYRSNFEDINWNKENKMSDEYKMLKVCISQDGNLEDYKNIKFIKFNNQEFDILNLNQDENDNIIGIIRVTKVFYDSVVNNMGKYSVSLTKETQ